MTTSNKVLGPKSKSYAKRICYNCYFSELFGKQHIFCRIYTDRKITRSSRSCSFYLKDSTKKDTYIPYPKTNKNCLNCYFESSIHGIKSSVKIRICRIYNKTLRRPYSSCIKWIRKDILKDELEIILGACSLCGRTVYEREMTKTQKEEFEISELCGNCQKQEFGE